MQTSALYGFRVGRRCPPYGTSPLALSWAVLRPEGAAEFDNVGEGRLVLEPAVDPLEPAGGRRPGGEPALQIDDRGLDSREPLLDQRFRRHGVRLRWCPGRPAAILPQPQVHRERRVA